LAPFSLLLSQSIHVIYHNRPANSSIILIGTSALVFSLTFSVALLSSLSALDLQWARTCWTSDIEIAYDVQQISDGGYILVGDTWFESAGWNDFYIVKTDAAGDTLWTRKCGGSLTERAYAVHQALDEGYYHVLLMKLDAEGNTLFDVMVTEQKNGMLLSSPAMSSYRYYSGEADNIHPDDPDDSADIFVHDFCRLRREWPP